MRWGRPAQALEVSRLTRGRRSVTGKHASLPHAHTQQPRHCSLLPESFSPCPAADEGRDPIVPPAAQPLCFATSTLPSP